MPADEADNLSASTILASPSSNLTLSRLDPAQSLFTFQNGAQTVGTLLSFDGSIYTISTPKGMRRFRAAGIKSIQTLAQR